MDFENYSIVSPMIDLTEAWLHIDLSDDNDTIHKLIQENASTAENIEVACAFRIDDEPQKPLQDIIDNFIKMGKTLTKVKSITISVDHAQYENSPDNAAPFPIYALKHFLQLRADTIVSVSLWWRLLLVGTPSEYVETCEVISQSKLIEKFALDSCSVGLRSEAGTRLQLGSSWVQDSLIEALTGIDTLQEVLIRDIEMATSSLQSPLVKLCQKQSARDLTMQFSEIRLPGRICEMICNASRIVHLALVDITNINDCDVVHAIAQSLRTNRVMRKFGIICSEEEDAVKPPNALLLLDMLQQNQGLDLMRIDLSCKDDSQYGERLTSAIKNIRHLKKLDLQFFDLDFSRTVTGVFSLLEGLKENQTLTHLRLNLCDGDSAEDHTCQFHNINLQIANSMRTNKVLQELKLIENDTEADVYNMAEGSEIDFWLRLNRLGRRHLEMHPNNRALWINTIVEHREQPIITFYLLGTNPMLCRHSGPTVPQKKRKR